MHLKKGKKRL